MTVVSYQTVHPAFLGSRYRLRGQTRLLRVLKFKVGVSLDGAEQRGRQAFAAKGPSVRVLGLPGHGRSRSLLLGSTSIGRRWPQTTCDLTSCVPVKLRGP